VTLKPFLHRFNLCLAALILCASPSLAQEALETPSLFDVENRFAIAIELGPAFLQTPVFRRVGIQPATKIEYKQPRYIGATFIWKVMRYARLELAVNFTSADLDSASQESAQQERALLDDVLIPICDVSMPPSLCAERDDITITLDARGIFLALGGFVSAYGIYPLTRNVSIYGGGGLGLVWSRMRHRSIVTRTYGGLRGSIDRDLYFSRSSLALLGGAGIQTDLFEGLVLDTGYQMIWAPELYPAGVSANIIHQHTIGVAFNF